MSHFSFTRASSDKCALEQKNKESTDPFEWLTDKSIAESKDVCFQSTSPFMQNPYRSVPSSIVDIESDLKGNTYNLSKCANRKYNPNVQKQGTNPLKECADNGLIPEYTRLNKSCNVFSGVTINRFQPLCENLQELNKIHNNSYIGINTRLHVKDAYTPKK